MTRNPETQTLFNWLTNEPDVLAWAAEEAADGADNLKDWVFVAAYDCRDIMRGGHLFLNGAFVDLLTNALYKVDWCSLAKDLLEAYNG